MVSAEMLCRRHRSIAQRRSVRLTSERPLVRIQLDLPGVEEVGLLQQALTLDTGSHGKGLVRGQAAGTGLVAGFSP